MVIKPHQLLVGFFLYATIKLNYFINRGSYYNATIKGENANSYVTLTEANDYFDTSPDSSTWTNKTDDQKKRALISATRWIDTLVFYGDRCDDGQALKFPRNNYQGRWC